jgi:hypothetical protein
MGCRVRQASLFVFTTGTRQPLIHASILQFGPRRWDPASSFTKSRNFFQDAFIERRKTGGNKEASQLVEENYGVSFVTRMHFGDSVSFPFWFRQTKPKRLECRDFAPFDRVDKGNDDLHRGIVEHLPNQRLHYPAATTRSGDQ